MEKNVTAKLFKRFIKPGEFPLPKDILAIDIGCGHFHYAEEYAQALINYGGKHHKLKIIATDIEKSNVEFAGRSIKRWVEEIAEGSAILQKNLKKVLRGKKANFITIFNPNTTDAFRSMLRSALEVSEKDVLIVVTTGEDTMVPRLVGLEELEKEPEEIIGAYKHWVEDLKDCRGNFAEASNVRIVLNEEFGHSLDVKLDSQTGIKEWAYHSEHIFILKRM
jgi:hypothetical protein